jgi:hypothetical protein
MWIVVLSMLNKDGGVSFVSERLMGWACERAGRFWKLSLIPCTAPFYKRHRHCRNSSYRDLAAKHRSATLSFPMKGVLGFASAVLRCFPSTSETSLSLEHSKDYDDLLLPFTLWPFSLFTRVPKGGSVGRNFIPSARILPRQKFVPLDFEVNNFNNTLQHPISVQQLSLIRSVPSRTNSLSSM